MESEIDYLTVNQVLDVLIDKGTLSKDVADTLRVPLWQKEQQMSLKSWYAVPVIIYGTPTQMTENVICTG
ncbi:hypothetical protein EMQU_3040 (plasmid) [Enterococcus mundtii QU 25]|uniref:hypothetical protein n=1 Tax=Enterococcus mundtii TaxID=53346 RepID=UPI0003C56B75|nr:hypothetical protein [Enterococcus mundtii]BAO08597.1 hypothetical protein EMQU_3040 [Enterococcus mundtii QU 25]